MLESVYADWAQGDYSRVEFFAPEIEFAYSSDFPDPTVFTGLDGLAEGWRRWLREWDDVRVAAERFVDLGERVLVEIVLTGSGKGSGAQMREGGANLWTFRDDGKAVRLEIFAQRDSARRAAGLD